MLSYFFMHDLVNNLDQKYKEQFKSFDRIFYCANYIKLMDYYNLLSFKADEYNLREKFENSNKQEKLMEFFITKAKEDNYNPDIILLAYGAIVNKSIQDGCKPYFDSLCGLGNDLKTQKKKQKLERIISYRLRNIFTEKNKQYKKVTASYTATPFELNIITTALADVFQFSKTEKIIIKCQNNLKWYYNQNINFLIFKRIQYRIIDKYSKSRIAVRPCLKTKLYKKKYDYLNTNNRNWLNPYTNEFESTSFHEIYQNILRDIQTRVEIFNQMLFYQGKKKTIVSNIDFVVENDNFVNPIFKRSTIFKTKYNKVREEKQQAKRQGKKDKKYKKYCAKRDKQLAREQKEIEKYQRKLEKLTENKSKLEKND